MTQSLSRGAGQGPGQPPDGIGPDGSPGRPDGEAPRPASRVLPLRPAVTFPTPITSARVCGPLGLRGGNCMLSQGPLPRSRGHVITYEDVQAPCCVSEPLPGCPRPRVRGSICTNPTRSFGKGACTCVCTAAMFTAARMRTQPRGPSTGEAAGVPLHGGPLLSRQRGRDVTVGENMDGPGGSPPRPFSDG